MAIYFETSDPSRLLKDFDTAVAKGNQAGGIATWSKVNGYYTHEAAQWKNKAFLKPAIGTNRLVFNIFKPQNGPAPSIVYGYYHGHLIETFANHFDQLFTLGSATALPVSPDNFS
jgi:hypothetical protein